MLLKEFFGKSLNVKVPEQEKDDKSKHDELFWFFIDHDRLHKDYVMPIGRKIKKAKDLGDINTKSIIGEFMPMVERGCMEYYKKNKMEGRPEKLFPKEMREEMCQRLYDHYYEDMLKGEYRL